MSSQSKLPHWAYYLMMAFVICTWGISPTVYTFFQQYYSASILSTLCTFGSAVLFFILAFRKLKKLDRRYLKIALPICLLNAFACLLQRIGLQYTSPSSYAFLEHLSCIVVPIMLVFLVRKKLSAPEIIAAVTCLAGCFILSGLTLEGISFGIGDILCGSAGIIFGVCIAMTGVYARELDLSLFMMIHMACYFLFSALATAALNFISVGGVVLEPIEFVWSAWMIPVILIVGLLDVGMCWLAKTEAMRNLNPTVVAITGPFAAVITAVLSVSLGMEELSLNLVVGAVLISIAVIISGIDDLIETKNEKKRALEK